MWLICGITLGALLIAAMKYCTEWSEDLFSDDPPPPRHEPGRPPRGPGR